MLRIFKQNTVSSAILLVLLAGLLRLPNFIAPHSYTYIQTAPLSQTLFAYLLTFPNHLIAGYIIAFVLVIFQAIFLNYIVIQHAILYKNTFLPGLFFILINSLYPEQFELTPQLISNTFILLMFQRLCFLYESPNPLLIVLDAGMYLGVALLFNYDVAVFLPYILISVVIFTSFNIRYLALSLIGISIPLYFVVSLYYLNNQLEAIILFTKQSLERNLLQSTQGDWIDFLPGLLLLPLSLFSAIKLQSNFFSNKVKTRRILQSTSLLFLFGTLGLLIENNHFTYALFYLSIPMSIVVAYYFIDDKRWLLKELLFWTLVGLSLYYTVFR